MTYTLVLLRHGESEWNAKNLFTGWVDVALSEKGVAEAKRGGTLLTDAGVLPEPLQNYLLDIQPGYDAQTDPVRAVYNHGWVIGDESALAAAVQARIDTLLEITEVDSGAK